MAEFQTLLQMNNDVFFTHFVELQGWCKDKDWSINQYVDDVLAYAKEHNVNVMSCADFKTNCEEGYLTDFDGYASAVRQDGTPYPQSMIKPKNIINNIQKPSQHAIHVIWYGR